MVVRDIDPLAPPYPTLPGCAWTIVAIHANGGGAMKNFAVDGCMVFERVEWLVSCSLSSTGLVCDGNIVFELFSGSRWTCEDWSFDDDCILKLHKAVVPIAGIKY